MATLCHHYLSGIPIWGESSQFLVTRDVQSGAVAGLYSGYQDLGSLTNEPGSIVHVLEESPQVESKDMMSTIRNFLTVIRDQLLWIIAPDVLTRLHRMESSLDAASDWFQGVHPAVTHVLKHLQKARNSEELHPSEVKQFLLRLYPAFTDKDLEFLSYLEDSFGPGVKTFPKIQQDGFYTLKVKVFRHQINPVSFPHDRRHTDRRYAEPYVPGRNSV